MSPLVSETFMLLRGDELTAILDLIPFKSFNIFVGGCLTHTRGVSLLADTICCRALQKRHANVLLGLLIPTLLQKSLVSIGNGNVPLGVAGGQVTGPRAAGVATVAGAASAAAASAAVYTASSDCASSGCGDPSTASTNSSNCWNPARELMLLLLLMMMSGLVTAYIEE